MRRADDRPPPADDRCRYCNPPLGPYQAREAAARAHKAAPAAGDPRVTAARELLACYDAHAVPEALAGAALGTDWTLTPWTMIGHLSNALRDLLAAVDEAAQPGGAR